MVNLGWFRVGEDRYAKAHKTFGITTLRKSHVQVRGSRISFRFRGKQRIWVRTVVVDSELADAMRELLRTRGRRLFRYRLEGENYNLTGRKLNDYIGEFMGEEFTAKDFRTWEGARELALNLEELGVVSLLRSWRIRRARRAA